MFLCSLCVSDEIEDMGAERQLMSQGKTKFLDATFDAWKTCHSISPYTKNKFLARNI